MISNADMTARPHSTAMTRQRHYLCPTSPSSCSTQTKSQRCPWAWRSKRPFYQSFQQLGRILLPETTDHRFAVLEVEPSLPSTEAIHVLLSTPSGEKVAIFTFELR